VSSLNQYAMPLKNRLIKNDSSTSVFSEVSISSTNNHYRFTENINNNFDGGININNKFLYINVI